MGQGLYGPLLDRYGRRKPLLIGIVIFVAGSVLAALAPSVEWLMAARFLQALGAAAGLVTPRAIVADLCTVSESARVFSLLMQVMMIAPIVAPILGGYLLGHGGWRAIFWTLAALGGAGLLWGMKSLPDSLPRERRVPLKAATFARAYARQATNAPFMAYTLAGGFVLGSLFSYISGSAFVFTQHFALTPTQFSLLFAGNSVALVLGGQLGDVLQRRGMREQRILFGGLGVHAAAGLALAIAVQADAAPLPAYAGLLALAIGSLGLVFGNLTALTMAQAAGQAGVASALMGMVQYLLSALIGYLVSLAATATAALPWSIAACGALALVLSRIGGRRTSPGTTPVSATGPRTPQRASRSPRQE